MLRCRIVTDIGARLGTASSREQEDHRERVDPMAEEAEKPKRRLVHPLQVVDGEQQWALLAEIGAEPVQAVEGAKRGVQLLA